MENKRYSIAVIGGSGKAGQYVVRELLHQGYNIRVLVRNSERFQIQHPAVQVIAGNVSHYDSIDALIRGCDAVFSTLGLGIPPSDPDIFSLATKNIIRAMTINGLHRYVAITGLNVDTSGDKKGAATQFATDWMYSNYPKSTADRQLEYDLLCASDLDWTLVRLPRIDQTNTHGGVLVSLEDCPGNNISAASLSIFLIRQLADKTYIRKAPFIADA